MTRPAAPDLTAAERETVERFDAAEAAPESLRERLAVALNDDGAYCGGCDFEDGLGCSECRSTCLGYADVVVAVMRGEDFAPPQATS